MQLEHLSVTLGGGGGRAARGAAGAGAPLSLLQPPRGCPSAPRHADAPLHPRSLAQPRPRPPRRPRHPPAPGAPRLAPSRRAAAPVEVRAALSLRGRARPQAHTSLRSLLAFGNPPEPEPERLQSPSPFAVAGPGGARDAGGAPAAPPRGLRAALRAAVAAGEAARPPAAAEQERPPPLPTVAPTHVPTVHTL